MSAPLDETYLTWLYKQVWSVRLRNPEKTYWKLLRQLYQTEFVWRVPNDDNRVQDGRDLRYEFRDAERLPLNEAWLGEGCSILEMLIALSRRLSFEADGEPRGWFWELIRNLDLADCTDANFDPYFVEEVTTLLNNRLYNYDGSCGLFPLEYPDRDQRTVEIWYQLQSYLMERSDI